MGICWLEHLRQLRDHAEGFPLEGIGCRQCRYGKIIKYLLGCLSHQLSELSVLPFYERSKRTLNRLADSQAFPFLLRHAQFVFLLPSFLCRQSRANLERTEPASVE
jgi:hypothetical protein